MLFKSRTFLEAIAIYNKEAHYLPDGRVLFLAAIYFCPSKFIQFLCISSASTASFG